MPRSKKDVAGRVAERAAATLVYVDKDLRVRFANRHCHELLGHAPDALHGCDLAELVDTATLKFVPLHVADVEKGRAAPREYALRHKDGTKKFVQVSAVADRDPAGRSRGYVLSTSDNAGERGAGVELRAAQQRFSLALEAAEAGFWSWDLANQTEQYSGAFQQLLGYGEGQFPAHFTFFGEIHPDDARATAEALAAAIRDGERFDREFRLRRAGGGWRWIRGIGQAFRDADAPAATRFQGVARDISARKRTELELREAQETVQAALERCSSLAQDLALRQRLDLVRRELLAAANHALRTPLASIIAALELLQDDGHSLSGGTPESLLALALENAGRLAVAVEQWVDMERIDTGVVLMSRLPVELDALVRGVLEKLGRPGGPAVQFIPARGECSRVSGDAERLRQAISHLVAGAIERSPAAATVKVSLSSREGRVRLAIEDEAPHAAGGDLGRLIADAIAKRSGGALRLEERPGKGTLAVLELPCAEEAVHG